MLAPPAPALGGTCARAYGWLPHLGDARVCSGLGDYFLKRLALAGHGSSSLATTLHRSDPWLSNSSEEDLLKANSNGVERPCRAPFTLSTKVCLCVAPPFFCVRLWACMCKAERPLEISPQTFHDNIAPTTSTAAGVTTGGEEARKGGGGGLTASHSYAHAGHPPYSRGSPSSSPVTEPWSLQTDRGLLSSASVDGTGSVVSRLTSATPTSPMPPAHRQLEKLRVGGEGGMQVPTLAHTVVLQ